MVRILLIVCVFFLFSCEKKRMDNDDYYKIINDLVEKEAKFDKCLLVYQPLKFRKVYRKFDDKSDPVDNLINFHGSLHILVLEKHISQEEAKDLYNNQDPQSIYDLDTVKILIKTVSEAQADTLLRFPGKINGKICRVSYPLFNHDKTLLLIRFEVNHSEGGQAANYLFKKENGNWILKNKRTDWVAG
jgi:hypothetical protein